MSEHVLDDASPLDVPPKPLPWHHRAPVLTMALNLALILTIFLTRERWEAWVVEGRDLGEGMPIDVPTVSVDAKRAVILRNDQFVLWDVETCTRLASLHPGYTYFTAFSPDGTKLLAAVESEDDRGLTIVVDAENGMQLATLDGAEYIREVSFSPDGRFILAATDLAHAQVWRVADGSRALRLRPHGDEFGHAEFSPDGGTILTYSAGEVSLWDVRTGKLRKRLFRADPQFTGAAFCADGKNVLVWLDGKAVLLDTEFGNCLARTEACQMGELSRDGSIFAVLKTKVGPVAILDAATGNTLAETQLSGVIRSSFADGDRRLLVERYEARGSVITVLNTRTGDVLGEFPCDHGEGFNLSPDGIRVLTRDPWSPARLHSARTGKLLAEWPDSQPVGFLGNDRVMLNLVGKMLETRILRRIRPEQWWGVFCLSHLYLIVVLGGALALSGWRDIKRTRARP